MNLYKISQTVNGEYDTYGSAVVCAPDAKTAQHMDPSTGKPFVLPDPNYRYSDWVYEFEDVKVELLGTAAPDVKQGVVIFNFRAG